MKIIDVLPPNVANTNVGIARAGNSPLFSYIFLTHHALTLPCQVYKFGIYTVYIYIYTLFWPVYKKLITCNFRPWRHFLENANFRTLPGLSKYAKRACTGVLGKKYVKCWVNIFILKMKSWKWNSEENYSNSVI